MSSIATPPVDVEALRAENEALRQRIGELEASTRALGNFSWITAQMAVALADRNRWLTGADNPGVPVTNDAALEHYSSNGQRIAFDTRFKKPNGERDLDKLVREFLLFLQTQKS